MKPFHVLLGSVLATVLAGCASSYRVVQVPQYGADLYPQSQTRSGLPQRVLLFSPTETRMPWA
jgi:hypothetical protein